MKYALIAAAIFVGWKLVNGQGGGIDFSVTATSSGTVKPTKPWAVPAGINVYNPTPTPQNNMQFWASRTHPDATSASVYMPPTGGVLVGPTGA